MRFLKTKKISILLLILILIFTFGCDRIKAPVESNSENSSEEGVPAPDSVPDPVTQEPIDTIQEKIDKMTIDEKIGQLVMAGVDGYTFNEHSSTLMTNYHVGGFILLGKNVKDTNQTKTLLNALKASNPEKDIPLFLGIDEEGGRVTRMPAEFGKFPSNKIIGQVNNPSFSFDIGGILGQELKAFGLNIDFAPVLDVNSNPKNPVIGDRSFGSNSEVVSKLGIQTMKGIQAQNIIASVKHFPGHGDTSVDSHVGLPVVNNDLQRLKSLELIPFSDAIKNGADMVMVAHILLPKIDPNNPASFSKTIITDILRQSLNFKGVVITDDMTMGAIVKNYNIGQAAVKSLNAGTDIVLVCNDFEKETEVLKAIKTSFENGTLSQQDIDEKVYRALTLKKKYNLVDSNIQSVNPQEFNAKISNLLKTYVKH